MLNYNHLYYFYVVHESGGVTEAGRRLGISQSALSVQLKCLEQRLGRKLLQREGARLRFTDEGQKVVRYCIGAFRTMEKLEEYLRCTEEAHPHKIQIGVCEETDRPFAAEVVSRMREAQIRMSTASHRDLVQDLAARRLDFILTSRPPAGHEDGIAIVAQLEMPVGLVGQKRALVREGLLNRSAAEILNSGRVSLVSIADGNPERLQVDRFLFESGIASPIIFECSHFSALIRVIAQGYGVGFVPLPYVKREIESGTLAFADGRSGFWTHSLYVSALAGSHGFQLAKALCHEVMEPMQKEWTRELKPPA